MTAMAGPAPKVIGYLPSGTCPATGGEHVAAVTMRASPGVVLGSTVGYPVTTRLERCSCGTGVLRRVQRGDAS